MGEAQGKDLVSQNATNENDLAVKIVLKKKPSDVSRNTEGVCSFPNLLHRLNAELGAVIEADNVHVHDLLPNFGGV